MKIRIIGSCGSGKSYIARELAKKFGIRYYELDNLVWDRSEPNLKFPADVRDFKLKEIIHTESWIIEGVHHKWGHSSFKEADLIYLIRPNKFLRNYRVIRRFIRTRLGLEQCNYKQSYKNLFQMLFIWNRGFDKETIKDILELTERYAAKRMVVRSNNEIMEHVEEVLSTDTMKY